MLSLRRRRRLSSAQFVAVVVVESLPLVVVDWLERFSAILLVLFDFDFEVLFFRKRNRIICIETRDIIFLTETIKILVLINDVENINSRNKKRESSSSFFFTKTIRISLSLKK